MSYSQEIAKYGTLVAAFSIGTEVTMLVVPFEPLSRSEKGCPLFVRLQHIIAVPAASLLHDVSFMHHCGRSCKTMTGSSRQVERQAVHLTSSVSFVHDTNNEVFYYNSFCLSN